MYLSYTEIGQLNTLQQQLYAVTNEITGIKKMLHQLVTDDCSVDMLFRLHNETTCSENQQLQEVASIIDMPFHEPHKREKPCCKEQVHFGFRQRSATRILNCILQEKELQRAELYKLSNELLQSVTTSPTQFLQHGNL